MAERKLYRLGVKQCEALKVPGMHADGGGLYLQISPAGGKSWVLRYRLNGRRKDMGLGSYAELGVKDARSAAEAAREQIKAGNDPIVARKVATVLPALATSPSVPIFGAFARGLMREWAKEFKSAPHRRGWVKTFGSEPDDLKPVVDPYAGLLLDMPLDDIDTAKILAALLPLANRPETQGRVRGRIERVLDAARVLGHLTGENPARWDGHLEVLLKRPKRMVRGHHKALSYGEAPAFMARLRAMDGGKNGHAREERGGDSVGQSISALALEFTILTAARSGETIYARRNEFDLDAALWTVPADRMKEGRVHRVPLSGAALAVLRKVWPFGKGGQSYVFRGRAGDGYLSNMAMAMCLRGITGQGVTVHGFRSTFRDWVGDETDYPREVAEAALSHLVGDQAEQAYRRGDALARRRRLMDDWASYLAGEATDST